jgi:hypothetical protein
MQFDIPHHRFRERLLVATAAAVLSAEADDPNLIRPWDPRPLAREIESLGEAEVDSTYEFATTMGLAHAQAVAFAIETLNELWPGAAADILGGIYPRS